MRSWNADGSRSDALIGSSVTVFVGMTNKGNVHSQKADRTEEHEQPGLDQTRRDLGNSIPIIYRDYCHLCGYR